MLLLEVKSMDKDVGSLPISHRSGRLARTPRPYRIFSVSMMTPEPDHNTLLLKIAQVSLQNIEKSRWNGLEFPPNRLFIPVLGNTM